MKRVWIFIILIVIAFLPACVQKEAEKEKTATLIFKHGKIAGNPEFFQKLLRKFEEENPGIKVKDETLPAATDEQHQFYVINLEGRSADFDVLSMDVIWVPEFARAGWLRDISHLLPKSEQDMFFPGPIQAVAFNDKVYAVPWYIDAGLLYYRRDLLVKYGMKPPLTWSELVKTAQYITGKEHRLYGFIWQGKQYEGLVCNVLEYLWSNGGDILRNGKVVADSPENINALWFMRNMIAEYGITPGLVTTAIEESTRHMFGNGKALFMRNWPYAWNIFQKEGSPVRGKIGVTTLPSFPGKPSASTLGGWQLGVNRHSAHPEAAEKLVRFLTSPEAQKAMALTIGYKPTRKSLYRDGDLIREQPFIAGLYNVFITARPRPVSPYYMMITQVMQPEFSAAISGIKTPEEALRSVQLHVQHIIEAGE
jgi:multiple sugar transport system substrate-binding protein